MAGELKKLCSMLKADDPELQCAVARVLGELKPKDVASIRCLGEAVSTGSPVASSYAVKALGRINSRQALPYLIPCLNADAERRAAAVEAIVALGDSAISALRKGFSTLNASGRIAAVDIILNSTDTSVPESILELLAQNDVVEVAAHVCERLRTTIESLPQKARESVLAKLRQFLASKKVRENAIAVVAGLRMLNFLRHTKAAPTFVGYLGEEQPPAVRRHALNALSALPLPKAPDTEMVKALLPLVSDRTYPDLVEVALRILSAVKIPASLTDEMIKLLYSRQSAVRRLAVRALSSFNSSRAARALLSCLDRNDWELGTETIAALRRITCTADLILKEVEHTEDRERARTLVGILRGAHFKASSATTQALTRRFFDMLARRDEMSEVYFTLLSSLDTDKLSGAVLARARKLKKSGKFSDAEYHLRLLAQAGPVGSEVKYELGVARLKLSPKSLPKSDRLNDTALPLFAELLRDQVFDLFRQITAEESLLDLDDCYYLGFHFAEGTSLERQFAAQMLNYVVRRAPSSEQAKAARNKMVAEGLGSPGREPAANKPATKAKKAPARKPVKKAPAKRR
jgi:HEAT repeat protein